MSKKNKLKPVPQPAISNKVTLDSTKKRVLHLLSGYSYNQVLPSRFTGAEWQVIRVGREKEYKPDILSSILHMSLIPKEQFQAVWSSYQLNRFYAHEVSTALKEWHRVLSEGGMLLINVPDVQRIAELIAKGQIDTPRFRVGEHMLTAHDVLFGTQTLMQQGEMSVACKSAFTARTLAIALRNAGFWHVHVKRDGMDLWATAHKLPPVPGKEPVVEISGDDLNAMMRARDELDKEPLLWKGFPPQAVK